MTAATLLLASVLPIAQDLFTAMVDGETGLLVPDDGHQVISEPVHAWVDIVGTQRTRAVVTTSRSTADRLTRCLLATGAEEPMSLADVQDVLGELANVVGGNLKGLLPEGCVLTLPIATGEAPPPSGERIAEQNMLWRGRALTITLWHLEEKGAH